MLRAGFLLAMSTACTNSLMAQDTIAPKIPVVSKPVKNTFDGSFVIDNQTCIVPIRKTFEFDIQHRFGTINNGYKDLDGIFAPANIRLGVIYTPINNLSVGFGLTKANLVWDGNIKYAILKQTTDWSMPVSLTFFGNAGVDTRSSKDNFVNDIDRISYFSQLMVACKITEKFSVQVSGSISYFNNVPGLLNSDSSVTPKMNNTHYAIAFLGRYKITNGMAVIANYDQPLTQHPMNNPHPNIAFGLELGTSGHSFQIFLGNYQSIVQQYNNVYNQNDYLQSRYAIGFNITRKWHF
jgi:hypothetical protein